MIHILNRNTYRPFRTSLALLKAIIETYRDEFAWRKPPYEYDFKRLPIDLILGDSSIRTTLQEGRGIEKLLEDCSEELKGFLETRKSYLIYKE